MTHVLQVISQMINFNVSNVLQRRASFLVIRVEKSAIVESLFYLTLNKALQRQTVESVQTFKHGNHEQHITETV